MVYWDVFSSWGGVRSHSRHYSYPVREGVTSWRPWLCYGSVSWTSPVRWSEWGEEGWEVSCSWTRWHKSVVSDRTLGRHPRDTRTSSWELTNTRRHPWETPHRPSPTPPTGPCDDWKTSGRVGVGRGIMITVPLGGRGDTSGFRLGSVRGLTLLRLVPPLSLHPTWLFEIGNGDSV